MTCYRPLQGWRSSTPNPKTGKFSIVFSPRDGYNDLPVQVPCGQCIGCRLERSRQWAIRCVHEAQLHGHNCFITLTFNDENLPTDRSLSVRTWQLFMKRFRKRFGDNIRFFMCGEYGEKFGRPHYHACIFNFDFPDRVFYKKSHGIPIYTSESLAELWPYGWSTIGDVTFESAAYVARYIMKKQTGDAAAEHYEWVDDYGEVRTRKPEFTLMSRRPGIGSGWLEKFETDVYPRDFVVMRGKVMKPPKFYDKVFEQAHPDVWQDIKRARIVVAKDSVDNSSSRLYVREKVKIASLSKLIRPLEQTI